MPVRANDGKGGYYSFMVLGTVAWWYRHPTVHDALHHFHEIRRHPHDKAGYVSHYILPHEVRDYCNQNGWILRGITVPDDDSKRTKANPR